MVNPVQSSAVAAYAQEALVRSQERNREQRGQQEDTPSVNESPRGERVTISQEARRLAEQNGEVENGQTTTQQTGDPQAVIRKQLEQNDEARLGAAKSATQAINAYRDNAVSRMFGG